MTGGHPATGAGYPIEFLIDENQRNPLPFCDCRDTFGGTAECPTLSSTISVRPVPRYTSYPTAPHFHAGITAETYRGWLAALAAGARSRSMSTSLFATGCAGSAPATPGRRSATRRSRDISQRSTRRSRRSAADRRPKAAVSAVHFGGGSPTMLTPARHGAALNASCARAFHFLPDAEISVEIDPNDMDDARFDALADDRHDARQPRRAGFRSEGADGHQPRAELRADGAVVDGARARGARSVNLDLLYGLAAPDLRQRRDDHDAGAVAPARPHRAVRLCPCALVEEAPDHDRRGSPAGC